jgi:hypothetical protein
MKTLILMALLVVAFNTDKQSYVSDYAKVKAAYNTANSLTFTVTYKSFDTNLAKPDTSFTGYFKVKGNKFYSKVVDNETCQNGKYYLAVDHGHKLIVFNKAINFSDIAVSAKPIDTLLKFFDVSKTDLKTGNRFYSISSNAEDFMYKSFSMEIDTHTFFIKRISIKLKEVDGMYEDDLAKYLEEPVVEMLYGNYQNTPLSDEVFDLSKYVTINSDVDVVPKGKYKSYTIINSLALLRKKR